MVGCGTFLYFCQSLRLFLCLLHFWYIIIYSCVFHIFGLSWLFFWLLLCLLVAPSCIICYLHLSKKHEWKRSSYGHCMSMVKSWKPWSHWCSSCAHLTLVIQLNTENWMMLNQKNTKSTWNDVDRVHDGSAERADFIPFAISSLGEALKFIHQIKHRAENEAKKEEDDDEFVQWNCKQARYLQSQIGADVAYWNYSIMKQARNMMLFNHARTLQMFVKSTRMMREFHLKTTLNVTIF